MFLHDCMCVLLCATVFVFSEIVHEDVKMSSDGESDVASSSDDVQSPVRVRLRNKKISTEVTHASLHTVKLSFPC